MRVVFFGTPDYAVPALAELIASGHEVAAAYTQPPRPRGRGHKLKPSPVQALAGAHGIEVRAPKSLKGEAARDELAALAPEIGVVVAYGLILPQAVLDVPPLGCVNLHGSLLPRWRGAAPIQRAIMAGDAETGVQLMKMEAGLDTGPVYLSERTPIRPDDTYQTLHDRLSRLGADLLPRGLAAIARGAAEPVLQAEAGVTYAHKVSAEEARVDWHRPARDLDAHCRGLSPFPGAWTLDPEGRRLKLLMTGVPDAEGSPASGDARPGTVLDGDDALLVATGEGVLRITKLQREGRAAQTAPDFLRGSTLRVGDVLGAG